MTTQPSATSHKSAPWLPLRDRDTGRLLAWYDPTRHIIELLANYYATAFRRRIRYRFLVDLRIYDGQDWMPVLDPVLSENVGRYHPRDRMIEVSFERYGATHTVAVSLDLALAASDAHTEEHGDAGKRERIPA